MCILVRADIGPNSGLTPGAMIHDIVRVCMPLVIRELGCSMTQAVERVVRRRFSNYGQENGPLSADVGYGERIPIHMPEQGGSSSRRLRGPVRVMAEGSQGANKDVRSLGEEDRGSVGRGLKRLGPFDRHTNPGG